MDSPILNAQQDRALAEFRYQIRRFLRFSEDAAHREGLEPQQHQLLLAIQAADEPTIGYVAGRLLIQHHSAVGLADRLADRGLLQRRRDSRDRRVVLLRLTEQGEAILHRLSGAHRRELRQVGPELVTALQEVLHNVSLREEEDVPEAANHS